MTEAAHQMASNPLNGVRKPGAVGVAAGPEIAIMDEAGRLLGRGETGEIVIRGDNVTAAYENNPKANARGVRQRLVPHRRSGRHRRGRLSDATGRLKEIINRGGEKISPREVDETLMDHPAVMQAVTFAVPHSDARRGRRRGGRAARGPTATEQELRAFVSERLAAFKTPRKIVFLAEIPKGATGKLQRIGLAQKLGLA